MSYTRESIIKEIDDFIATGDLGLLYDQNFVKRRGSKGKYMRFAAERLLEYSEELKNIPAARRKDSYNTQHDGTTPRPADGRKGEKAEDRIAMKFFKKTLPHLGSVIDYQTPLKDGRDSAIDLLAYNGESIYILELKRPDSKETLLRCVLEAYTYYRMVDKNKLLHDFYDELQEVSRSEKTPCLRKAALVSFVDKGRAPYTDFNDTSVKKLMKALGVDLFVLDENGKTIIEAHYFEELEGL